jgi:hypothetical protein
MQILTCKVAQAESLTYKVVAKPMAEEFGGRFFCRDGMFWGEINRSVQGGGANILNS